MSGIGIVFPMGQSRKLLEKSGQWDVWEQELEIFRKYFQQVVFFESRYRDIRRFLEASTFPLYRKKDLERCDLLFGVHLSGALLCFLAKLRFGIPYVVSYAYDYGEFAWREKKWTQWIAIKLLTKLFLHHADLVIVPTEKLKKHAESFGARRAVVIPNGVNTELFRPALKGLTLRPQGQALSGFSSTINHQPLIILSVGRLEPQKNFSVLVEAVARLKKSFKGRSFRVVLVGQGSLEKELKDQAEKQEVHLTIHRSVQHEQLPDIYRSAGVFVLPSLFEGHPKVLLEAMSCGLPVIASDIPGCRDIVTNQHDGLLVRPTVGGLQRGLEQLLNDQRFAAKLGRNARQTILSKYDKKILMKKEIQLLHKTIGDR